MERVQRAARCRRDGRGAGPRVRAVHLRGVHPDEGCIARVFVRRRELRRSGIRLRGVPRPPRRRGRRSRERDFTRRRVHREVRHVRQHRGPGAARDAGGYAARAGEGGLEDSPGAVRMRGCAVALRYPEGSAVPARGYRAALRQDGRGGARALAQRRHVRARAQVLG